MPESRRVKRRTPSRFSDAPSPVDSSSRPGRVIVSGETKAPKRQFAWRKIFQTTGLVIIFCALIWIILFSHWLNVRKVSLAGSSTVSQPQLQATVDDYFKQRPLQKNILFTDNDDLSAAVRSAYPTFIKVNIYRTLFLTLQVQVKEVSPALIWKTGNEAWVIGTDGRILRPIRETETIAGSVTDTAQLKVETGKKVANASFVSFIEESYKSAAQYNLKIKDVTIGQTTQEANLVLDNNITVKVDTTDSASDTLSSVRRTIDTATQTKKPVTAYIDVRVPGKAYYK